LTYHLPRIRVLVDQDRILERPQEILLEPEMRQFLLLQEVHSELPERVKRKEANVGVVMAAYLRSALLYSPNLVLRVQV